LRLAVLSNGVKNLSIVKSKSRQNRSFTRFEKGLLAGTKVQTVVLDSDFLMAYIGRRSCAVGFLDNYVSSNRFTALPIASACCGRSVMFMLASISYVGGNLHVPEAVKATETGSGKVRAEQEAMMQSRPSQPPTYPLPR
jgi:hypothetical protein